MSYEYKEKLCNRIIKMYLKNGSVWYPRYCKLIEAFWTKYGKRKDW